MKQIWHTSSDNPTGSNRVGFGTEESDQLIDELSEIIDPKRRREIYLRLQEIIYAEQAYIFLVCPSGRIMIRKGIENPNISPLQPGYQERTFHSKH